MPYIKLTNPRFANLTGQLPGKNFRGVAFVNGVSTADLNQAVADKIAAQLSGTMLCNAAGVVSGPAGSLNRLPTSLATEREWPRSEDIAPFEKVGVDGTRIAVIGTSLVQQNDTGSVASNKISHSSRGWLSWARFYSQELFYSPIWFDASVYRGWEPSSVPLSTRGFQGLNAGVSGQTAQEIWDRRDFLVNHVDCDIVVIDAGTNDMGAMSKEEIQSLREKLADYYLSYGKKVILLPILARSAVAWPLSATRQRANWINHKTREFCRSRQRCYFFDWNDAWVNAASAIGEPRTGFSNDGTHFAPKGGEPVGKAFAEFLKTILPAGHKRVASAGDVYDAVSNPLGNLLTNTFLIGATGTVGTAVTGAVATGMRMERSAGNSSAVASLEARANRGNWQVATITPSGTGESKFYFRTAAADTVHEFAEGDWVQASCEIETNAYAGFTGVTLFLQDTVTGGIFSYAMEPFNNGSANDTWAAQARAGTLVTPPLKLGAGSNRLRWRVEITFDSAVTGEAVVKMGAVELRKIADPMKAIGWSAP